MRVRLLGALALAAAAAGMAACAPKGGSGDGDRQPTPVPGPKGPAWAEEARSLVELGLGGARRFWNDPEIRPGERVRWVVTTAGFPHRILEVRHDASPANAETWTFVAGHPSKPARTLALSSEGGRVTALEWGDEEREADADVLAAVVAGPLPALVGGTAGEAAFAAAGGRVLGNEVLRVPAGDFRARHAMIARPGHNWHLYLVRTVPGGIAKVERFPAGSVEPTLVLELDDYTRLPPPPRAPAPPPPPSPGPTPSAP